MAALFNLPRGTLLDANGIIIPGGGVSFFAAGTSTPLAVYSDHGLTTPLSQPVAADAAGRLPAIYLTTGAFKIVVTDAVGATIYTNDYLDSGLPASTGAVVAALPAFFTATTQAGARSALGAAAASDVTTLSSAVSAIQAQITAVGGTLGTLAGLSTVAQAQLASGFGTVELQSVEIGGSTALITCAGTVPYDDTIPQISEGTQVFSGSFTPKSASSVLQAELVICGALSTGNEVGFALFKDATANALIANWDYSDGTTHISRLSFYLASPGTSAFTLQARVGGASGTFYVNGNSSGARIGGGSVRSYLRVTERLVF